MRMQTSIYVASSAVSLCATLLLLCVAAVVCSAGAEQERGLEAVHGHA
jgi:hypothetical protein